MTVTAKVLIQPKQVESTQITQYTATAATAIIDKFTVTNISAAIATFSANLVTFNGAPGLDNLIIDTRSIAPNETYTCPELVGHVLITGDSISTIASAAASLTLRASGREITA